MGVKNFYMRSNAMKYSPLQQQRYRYKPKLPKMLQEEIHSIVPVFGEKTESETDQQELKKIFAHTYGKPVVTFARGSNQEMSRKRNIGAVLSGGQAPGGHNVISGIFDALREANPESKLFGFLGGPSGILDDKLLELTPEIIDEYRNTGGFDIIGSGRTKIETKEQYDRCAEVCRKHSIDSLVIIGGDDSNTNAALLAEYFLQHDAGISVIGVPKTIDGDLKNQYIETSFGFDTATKTYSELIGNIQRDSHSARKYWHFIKLMGRSASHICLECALQTQPSIALISEEVARKKQTLHQIVEDISQVIAARSEAGKNYGVVLVPEGLIEFIPEMGTLIGEINDLLARRADEFAAADDTVGWVAQALAGDLKKTFSSLPRDIQLQLLMDRDPHGNVQVSRIETEKLLILMVENRLKEMKQQGEFTGSFSSQNHFFGYEGRCAFPSNFDADYCYSLGYNAFMLISAGLTGYISSVTNLASPADEWKAGGIPITMMMNLEQRHGTKKPVIKKALVDLDGAPFALFAAHRETWASETSFVFPGAIQYFGPPEVCDQPTATLKLEHQQ